MAVTEGVVRKDESNDRVVLGIEVRDVEKSRLEGVIECASNGRVGMGSLARHERLAWAVRVLTDGSIFGFHERLVLSMLLRG